MSENKAPSSPDRLELRTAPVSSARLSKKAAFAAASVLAAVALMIVFNISKEPPKHEAQAQAQKHDLEPALTAGNKLTEVPDFISPPQLQSVPELPAANVSAASAQLQNAPSTVSPRNAAGDPFTADTSLPGFAEIERTATRSQTAPEEHSAERGSGAEPDLNQQERKLAFLSKSRRSTYLDARLTAPVSPFEMKTGTVIPGVLLSEINSDLPGEIIAQVSQNVYDTATGNHLLIPQGTKLFGRYDSKVAFGQGRLLVMWQRLIYPDASTLKLDGMSGHDQAGQSGFADRVDHHYGRIFGWGLLTSVLSAGYQLSQPQDDDEDEDGRSLSSQQIAAAAVGQQMAQLGAKMAERNMEVQPTITVRKGFRLNVMVNKDVVFPGSYDE